MHSRKPVLVALLALSALVAAWIGTTWISRPVVPGALIEPLPALPERGVAKESLEAAPDLAAIEERVLGESPAPYSVEGASDSRPAPDASALDAAPSRLRVRVVDGAGEPVANAPVHRLVEYAMFPGRLDDDAVGMTDANGLALLEDLERDLGLRFRPPAEAGGFRFTRFGLRCGFSPGDEDAGFDEAWIVWLAEEPAPGTVIDVPCPDLGWLRVALDGPGAVDVTERHPLRVLWVRRVDGSQSGTRGWSESSAAPGTVRLGPFPLDWELTLRLSQGGRAEQMAWEDVDGPRRAGEVVEVALGVPASRWITGVALRESGEPYSAVRLAVYVGDPDGPDGSRALRASVVTDATGAWRAGVPADPAAFESVEAGRLVVLGQGSSPEPRGEVALPVPLALHTTEVGEVVVREALRVETFLVSGRVTGTDGAPLQRATVVAYAVRDGVREERDSASESTGQDGAYRLVVAEAFSADELEVFAFHGTHLRREGRRVPVGSPGVDFALVPGGGIGGELLFGEGVNPMQLEAYIQRGEARGHRHSLESWGSKRGGNFQGLESGTWTVRLGIEDTTWTLFEATAEVVAGETADVGPIDLRGELVTLNLRLFDAQGEPIERESFRLENDAGEGYRQLGSDREGWLQATVPGDTPRVWLRHAVYGDRIVPVSADVQELTLTK